MNTQEYLRLDYLKQRGGELTIGDEYLFYTKHYIVGGKLLRELSAQSEYDTDRSITHFEFRDNKSELDLPDYFPIEVVFNGGDTLKKYNVGDVRCFGFGIQHWRPDYDALLKQQQDYDAIEALKNTYRSSLSSSLKDIWEQAVDVRKSTDILNSINIERQPFSEGIEESIKKEEKQMTKLTSKDIEWHEGMICAVVANDSNEVSMQYSIPCDNIGDIFKDVAFKFNSDLYNSEYFYTVEREQDVPEEGLIYTVAMKEKGELPKSGMKCLVDDKECLYIGIDLRGHTVLERLEDDHLVVAESTKVYPLKTEAELKAEREEELKSKVAEVISNNSGSWLSKEYFKKHAQDLFDQGLLKEIK